MTLDEIQALQSPEVRPDGMGYEVYQKLCFKAGVSEPISKAGWSNLPIMNITKASAEEDEHLGEEDGAEKTKKQSMKDRRKEMRGEMRSTAKAKTPHYDMKKDEDMGDGDDDSDAGDETEEAEIDEDEEEEERGMDDIADKVEKGNQIEMSDLLKAIDAYAVVEDALSKGEDLSTRESYLQARLDAGTINKSERVELGRIWSGIEDEPEPTEYVQKSLSTTMDEDDNASQLVDASDFLRTLVKGVDTRMDQVLGEVSRDGRATRELLKAQGSLIKSLASHASQQDSVIKAMTARLEGVETTPVARRAVSSNQDRVRQRPFAKSVGGGVAREEPLSKAKVTEALRALMIHASEDNDSSAMDRLSHATALYEQTGTLPQNVMQAVRQVS